MSDDDQLSSCRAELKIGALGWARKIAVTIAAPMPRRRQADAVWSFFDAFITPELQSKTKSERSAEEGACFTGYIGRHALQLQGTLWGSNRSDSDLQRFLLTSAGVSDEILKSLLAKTTLEDITILGGEIPPRTWVMMVTSDFLPYSTAVLEVIIAQRSGLEGYYLAARWKEVRGQIDLPGLALSTVLTLSKSNAPTVAEKMQMWSGISLEALSANPDAFTGLAHVCAIANTHVPAETFIASFFPMLKAAANASNLTSDQRSEILIQALPSMSWMEARAVLEQLDHRGFSALGPQKDTIEVPSSDVNLRLMAALESRGFLGNVKASKDKIKATTNPDDMTELTSEGVVG